MLGWLLGDRVLGGAVAVPGSGLVATGGVPVSVLHAGVSGVAVSLSVWGGAADAVVVIAAVVVVAGTGVEGGEVAEVTEVTEVVELGAIEWPPTSMTNPYAARASTTIPIAPAATRASGRRDHGIAAGARS